MALGVELKQLSLVTLISKYTDLSESQQKILTDINEMFALNDYALCNQSDKILSMLHAAIKRKTDYVKEDAEKIYALLHERLEKESYENKKKHQQQGRFSSTPLHQRALTDEMQDDDLQRVMPKSIPGIEIFAPVNRFDASLDAVQVGIKTALADERVKHLVIPVGPGHWRGLFFTKSEAKKDQIQLEIFDPYGAANAKGITDFAKALITGCGISQKNLSISYSGPKKPQKDIYACGDFTCAESHRKLKSWGAKDGFNQSLINTLENHGNKNHKLRYASRAVTQSLMGESEAVVSEEAHQSKKERSESSTTDPNNKANKAHPTAQDATKKSNKAGGASNTRQSQKQQPSSLQTRLQELESKMDANEKKVYHSAVKEIRNPSIVFKREVAWLIKNRETIFKKAEKAVSKEKQSHTLSDEELAAKLQAEEIKKSGLS